MQDERGDGVKFFMSDRGTSMIIKMRGASKGNEQVLEWPTLENLRARRSFQINKEFGFSEGVDGGSEMRLAGSFGFTSRAERHRTRRWLRPRDVGRVEIAIKV